MRIEDCEQRVKLAEAREREARQTGYPAELYDGAPPRSDPETSAEAAESVREVSGRLRRRVFEAIECSTVGATDDEIEVWLGLPHQTVNARRRELVLLGRIVDSGDRRQTRQGRRAKVWIPKPLGPTCTR